MRRVFEDGWTIRSCCELPEKLSQERRRITREHSVLKGLKGASISFPPNLATLSSSNSRYAPQISPHLAAPIQPKLAVVPTTSLLNKIAGKNISQRLRLSTAGTLPRCLVGCWDHAFNGRHNTFFILSEIYATSKQPSSRADMP